MRAMVYRGPYKLRVDEKDVRDRDVQLLGEPAADRNRQGDDGLHDHAARENDYHARAP